MEYILLLMCTVSRVAGTQEETFDFLIIGEEFQVSTHPRIELVSLEVIIDFNTVSSAQLIQDMEGITKEWLAYPPFKKSAPLSAEYYAVTSTGVARLIKVSQWLERILPYRNEQSTYQLEYSCRHNHTAISIDTMVQDVKNMKQAFKYLKTDWTPDSIKTNMEQATSINTFANVFSDSLESWDNHLGSLLSILDSLGSHTFPQSLMGHYQGSTCIQNQVGEHITVLDCKTAAKAYVCDLEITVPSEVKTMHSLIPVHYNNICLRAFEASQQFAREVDSKSIQVLDCNHYEYYSSEMPTCHILEYNLECSKQLLASDISQIIVECNFTKEEPPLGTRTLSKGLLIQGRDLSTQTRDGASLSELSKESPILVFFHQEIVVTQEDDEFSFTTGQNISGTKLVKTRLSSTDIIALEAKYKWQIYWEQFTNDDFLRFLLIGFQAILYPIAALGVILGMRARKKYMRLATFGKPKKTPKENYKSNKVILKNMKS